LRYKISFDKKNGKAKKGAERALENDPTCLLGSFYLSEISIQSPSKPSQKKTLPLT